MLKSERHHLIVQEVEKNGKVLVNDLTNKFDLAEVTIRKDLQTLAKEGLIKRVHGGAIRVDNSLINFEDRIETNVKSKQKIAQLAVRLLENKKIIYIDSGSTNLFFAKAIPLNFSGTVITNSPLIALHLCSHNDIKIMLLPGELNKTSKVIEGPSTLKAIESVNIDICILGISSLNIDKGITVPSIEESYIKRQIIKQSSEIIGIVTKEKFETISTYKVDDIEKIDTIVTENTISGSILKPYLEKGIQIINT